MGLQQVKAWKVILWWELEISSVLAPRLLHNLATEKLGSWPLAPRGFSVVDS